MLRFDLDHDAHLRLFAEPDADELQALIEANREHLAPWMPWSQQSAEDTAAYIRECRQAVADDTGLPTALVVEGRIAGSIRSHEVDREHGTVDLGYWIGAGWEGRGLVTRAVAAHIDHAFGTWGLRRVEIQVAVHNARSRAVPERLGFTCEGIMRDAYVVGDEVHDLALYSLLAREWASGRAAA